jgi:hypothetical protein
VTNAPRKKQRTFRKKYKGKNFNIMMKPTGSKSNANKFQVWNGDKYLKR